MEKMGRGVLMFLLICIYHGIGYAQQVQYTRDDENVSMLQANRNTVTTRANDQMDRRKRFQDPQAPRFQLQDRDGKFTLGIGGRVRTALNYDFHGFVDSPDFYPSLIHLPGAGNYSRNQFRIDASASSIYLKLLGHTSRLGDFVVYVNGYFRGSNNTLRMHNAYVSFLGFTLGWDYGLFTDAAGSPPTIDYEGPAGQVLYRTSLLHYTHTFSPHWSAGIGVEIPEVDATVTGVLSVNTQRAPNVPAFVQYNWSTGSHFRLAGVVRPMTYSSDADKKAYTKTGWGTQASTAFQVRKGWKTFGQVTYGKGIGRFFNDMSTLTLDLVPDAENAGRMQVLPMLGWYAGLQYNFTPGLFVSSTYSQSRVYRRNGYSTTNEATYRYGQYLAANLFWNITSNLSGGAEYLRGWKTGFDNHTSTANRLSLLMQYSF